MHQYILIVECIKEENNVKLKVVQSSNVKSQEKERKKERKKIDKERKKIDC